MSTNPVSTAPAFATTDLCDLLEDMGVDPGSAAFQVAAPALRDFGGRCAFHGAIATVRCHEDNSLVRATLETPGGGRVLVVDGGASRRCALLGDRLAALALQQGWSGVLIWGCVRDSAALRALPLGVKALATHPRRSVRRGGGQAGEALRFASVEFCPGWQLYADEDGIVVIDPELFLSVTRAATRAAGEAPGP